MVVVAVFIIGQLRAPSLNLTIAYKSTVGKRTISNNKLKNTGEGELTLSSAV